MNISLPFGFTEPITQAFPPVQYISFPVKTYQATATYVSTCDDDMTPDITITRTGYSFTSQELAYEDALADATAIAIAVRTAHPCPGV